MKEQKFKVVKCLEHIPKWAWGNILEDDKTCTWYNDLVTCQLKPSDTFPLPEQGDEVEVSDNGIKWCGKERWTYNFVSYYASVKSFITIDEAYATATWKYIRPIEQASAAVGTSSTTCISDAGVADGIFVIKNKLGEPSCVKYISPIEQASAAVGTSSTTCVNEADEMLLALRDIQKDLHGIFEHLKDN